MNMKNNCRFPEEKRQLFLLFLGSVSIVGVELSKK